ncbi:type IV pilus twitching motility protein PilT [Demequina sp. SYSU T00068]|uniref:type IV pilus twitching motility protein PilT n=1 Tax=Demequina lignilytica TaxID=3051663 RepID=UPI002607F2D0|nr:type IV pilus twitching motility protein PilT [Demequina sp. SYSU T00068]MDN4489399.1 type IV pilus twitching motility protein PilT [Demequina sp. SYSU T00068]
MSMQFTPGEQPWRPTPPPAQPAAPEQPADAAEQGAPATSPEAAPAAPAAAAPPAYQPPAAPAQPAPQPPAAGGPALHQTGQAPARSSFLEEQRPLAAAPQMPAPTHQPSVRAQGIPASAQEAPAASSFAAFEASNQAAAEVEARPAPAVDPAQAFAAAAAAELPAAQRAFAPAPEPVEEKKEARPAPIQVKPRSTQIGARVGMSNERQESDLDVNAALRGMMAVGASDLHVTAGVPPMVRLDGALTPLEGFERLTPESLQRSLYGILTQAQRERFEEELELDFSYSVVGEARFRVNLYKQRDALGAAFRVIPYEIKPLEALGIPEVVGSFSQLPRGLVLVTGPTGSGKSTTLASLVDLANRSRSAHIMTVEDPIEFLHRHKRSIVNQREVGADTRSFNKALKHVLRQDPDIILIGEMRDLETISVALTAAETGHLVFATLHTQSAPATMDRIIDVFPPEQQGQVRTQLAAAIQGVMCQTLLKRADGPGRAVAVEIMVATPGIRNLIREGKTHQIYTSLQGGASMGMQTMDYHLAELVKSGRVDYEAASEMAHSQEEFNRLCGRHGR